MSLQKGRRDKLLVERKFCVLVDTNTRRDEYLFGFWFGVAMVDVFKLNKTKSMINIKKVR